MNGLPAPRGWLLSRLVLVFLLLPACSSEKPAAERCCDPRDRPNSGVIWNYCCADRTWHEDESECADHGGEGEVWRISACCDEATRPDGSGGAYLCCGDGSWDRDDDCADHGGECAICEGSEL